MQTKVFHEFDAFASSISGVDSKMLLRDPERQCWTIDRLGLPGIEVQIGRLASGNIACGQLHSDCCMLYLPLTNGIEYKGNGSVIHRDSFFVLYPNAEFCITTKESHDWCALTIPVDYFGENSIASLSRPCRVSARSPAIANHVQDIVSNVMSASTDLPGFEDSRAAKSAASTLLSLLAPIPTQQRTESPQPIGRPKITRDEIICRSLAVLEKDSSEHTGVVELAAKCDVSERTLRTAFREYFGLGPSRFLQLRQLHQVRRALLSADPDHVTVSQVLAHNGVWAFGRFASRYRRLFGELPSATLNASKEY